MICKNCGSEMPDDVNFCINCGNPFEKESFEENEVFDEYKDESMEIKICKNCGVILQNEDLDSCEECGFIFDDENKPLILNDENRFYRVCNNCSKVYDIENQDKICEICGSDIDLTPRSSDELIQEGLIDENEFNEAMAAKERARIAKEALAQKLESERFFEEQKKIKEELAIKRKKKIKKLIKILSIIFGIIFVLISAALLIWKSFDDKNIQIADDFLAKGDYKTAVEYYGYVMPIGSVKEECDEKIRKINAASEFYENAKKEYASNEYFKALVLSKKALTECSEFLAAKEIYNKSQTKITAYLQNEYNNKKYVEVYKAINEIDITDRTEGISLILKNIEDIVKSHISKGKELLKNGNPEESIKSVNAALMIIPDNQEALEAKTSIVNYYTDKAKEKFNEKSFDECLKLTDSALAIKSDEKNAKDLRVQLADAYTSEGNKDFNAGNIDLAETNVTKALVASADCEAAKKLKQNISDYKNYESYMIKARNYYDNASFSDAKSEVNKIPSDDIGNKVKSMYQYLIDNIENDYKYASDPVKIMDKEGYTHRDYFNGDYCDFYYTLENKLSKSVYVTIKITSNDDYYNYYTYTLSPYENRSCHDYMYDVYISYYSNQFKVEVYDFEVVTGN